jgi:hypothetical protein
LDRKNNPRIAAQRPSEKATGLRSCRSVRERNKKELNPLDEADFVRDVANRGIITSYLSLRLLVIGGFLNSNPVDRHEVNTVAATLALFPKEFSRASTTCVRRCSNRYKMATEAL